MQVIQATDTSGNTVDLRVNTPSSINIIDVCDTQIIATSGVLLGAANYAAVPGDTYVAGTHPLASSRTVMPCSAADLD